MITVQKPRVVHHPIYGLYVEYDPLTPHFGNYFDFTERKQLEQESGKDDHRGTKESTKEV